MSPIKTNISINHELNCKKRITYIYYYQPPVPTYYYKLSLSHFENKNACSDDVSTMSFYYFICKWYEPQWARNEKNTIINVHICIVTYKCLQQRVPNQRFFLFKKIPIHSSGAIKRNSKTLILASDANSVFTLNCTFCYIEFSLCF